RYFLVAVQQFAPPTITLTFHDAPTNNTYAITLVDAHPISTPTGGALKGCNPASGSSFNVGTTTVTCTATNLCTTNQCSFVVAVKQLAWLTITLTCPAAVTDKTCANRVVVNYANPNPTCGAL